MHTPANGAAQRAQSLDGLRGVAALVVVLGHVLPSVPALSGPIRDHWHASGWAWWISNTPLQLFWDGADAVVVFFVLSGFVLVVGRQRDRAAWLAYYPSRLARLYLPVLGSLVVAVVLTRITFEWTPVSERTVLKDLVLLRGVDGLNPPLWSLQWEVLFSVLLPAYVMFARWRPGLWPIKVALLLTAVAVGGYSGHASLACLPLFGIGAMIATEYDRGSVPRLLSRLTGQGRRWLAVWTVMVAALLYGARALAAASSEPTHSTLVGITVLVAIGATLIVLLALYCPPVRAALSTQVVQWLGVRSFSLYLVHYPMVAAIMFYVGDAGGGTLAYLALPTSLLAAEAFYRTVERPAHRLARRIDRAVRSRRSSPAAVDAPVFP